MNQRGFSFSADSHGLILERLPPLSTTLACTTLLRGGRLYLAEPQSSDEDEDELRAWRFEGDEAVMECRFTLHEIQRPRSVRAYSDCKECLPVLVRTDGSGFLRDIVGEHRVYVDFELTLRPGEPVQIERTSGTREDLTTELAARGLCVLRDDEALAVAHRELQAAQRLLTPRGSARSRRG